ncbi:MAG: hypothetical protein OXQ31_19360 [Spirochaetaceae bacterium]|nr:hypothetical protein [Spirochaetaceae bacterium]
MALAALLAAVAIAQTTPDRGPSTYGTMPIRDLVKRAEQGELVSMVVAAYRYALGIGVPSDQERSGHWARAAAEHGDPLGAALYAYWIGIETGVFPSWDSIAKPDFFHPNYEHEHLYLEGYAWASIARICDETMQEVLDAYAGILDDAAQRAGGDDLAAQLLEEHFGGAVDCERDPWS